VSSFIIGSGIYLPEGIVSNEEIAARLGLEPEQIFKSSGIRRRRWADPGTKTSSLGVEALRLALDDARLVPEQIDYLILGSMTPDRYIPGSSPAVQATLGLPQIPCLDIRACNWLAR
jgi:3-oxoacyl-[acyl-carrier-protein] synthase-3